MGGDRLGNGIGKKDESGDPPPAILEKQRIDRAVNFRRHEVASLVPAGEGDAC